MSCQTGSLSGGHFPEVSACRWLWGFPHQAVRAPAQLVEFHLALLSAWEQRNTLSHSTPSTRLDLGAEGPMVDMVDMVDRGCVL